MLLASVLGKGGDGICPPEPPAAECGASFGADTSQAVVLMGTVCPVLERGLISTSQSGLAGWALLGEVDPLSQGSPESLLYTDVC